MTSYTLQVQPRKQYVLQYSNQRGPQGPAGAGGGGSSNADDIVSGTLDDDRLSPNVALENVANVFAAKQSFSGVDHVGLCLNSLTTAQYNALTATNGDIFRDSTTDRIDARLARGTVELIDSAGGQVIGGSITTSGFIKTTANGAASTPPMCVTGTWFSGGTGTTTKPQLLIEPNGTASTTWNANGTAIGVNAASGFSGSLLDLKVNNSTLFGVSFQGVPTGNGYRCNAGWTFASLGDAYYDSAGTSQFFRIGGTTYLTITSSGVTTPGTVRPGTYTVGTLPSASANTRARAFVTDSNLAFTSANLGSTVTAGGAILVPVFSNGTNWVIG